MRHQLRGCTPICRRVTEKYNFKDKNNNNKVKKKKNKVKKQEKNKG